MSELFFHVRDFKHSDIELDPNDFFQVVEAPGGDFIVPHSSTQIYAFLWEAQENEKGMHLFVYVEKTALCQLIPYPGEDEYLQF